MPRKPGSKNWSREEIDLLITYWDKPTKVLVKLLNKLGYRRNWKAINIKLNKLRHRGWVGWREVHRPSNCL